MAGLEDLGIPGGDYLRESLTNCSDPLAAIEEFQTENGILLPSLRPALPFLDLFVIKRLDRKYINFDLHIENLNYL
jgi:negative elongation factor B